MSVTTGYRITYSKTAELEDHLVCPVVAEGDSRENLCLRAPMPLGCEAIAEPAQARQRNQVASGAGFGSADPPIGPDSRLPAQGYAGPPDSSHNHGSGGEGALNYTHSRAG